MNSEKELQEILQKWINEISAAFGKLEALAQAIEESFEMTPRARRRKVERERARHIEQRYRAEIRRCERDKPYRRIYKPP